MLPDLWKCVFLFHSGDKGLKGVTGISGGKGKAGMLFVFISKAMAVLEIRHGQFLHSQGMFNFLDCDLEDKVEKCIFILQIDSIQVLRLQDNCQVRTSQ